MDGMLNYTCFIDIAKRGVTVSQYEFSLRQEVLLEVGSSILGDLFRYSEEKGIEDDADPVSILYNLVWNVKQDIILSKTESELEQIEGQFHLARDFLSGMETAQGKGLAS